MPLMAAQKGNRCGELTANAPRCRRIPPPRASDPTPPPQGPVSPTPTSCYWDGYLEGVAVEVDGELDLELVGPGQARGGGEGRWIPTGLGMGLVRGLDSIWVRSVKNDVPHRLRSIHPRAGFRCSACAQR